MYIYIYVYIYINHSERLFPHDPIIAPLVRRGQNSACRGAEAKAVQQPDIRQLYSATRKIVMISNGLILYISNGDKCVVTNV